MQTISQNATSRRLRLWLLIGLFVALVLILVAACNARSKAVRVTTCDVNGLINAIHEANRTADEDIIELDGTCIYTLAAVVDEVDGANGLPSITTALTIEGNGTTIERSPADDTPDFRLFHVSENARLTVDGLTLRYGSVLGEDSVLISDSGGAIFNRGQLAIINSTLTYNSAEGPGSAIYNLGLTGIDNSTISDNVGPSAAIYNHGNFEHSPSENATLAINNSTISNNGGAAIYNAYGWVAIANSTLYHNEGDRGGAIANLGTLAIENSTISDNASRLGGGVFNEGSISIIYSVFSGNSAEDGGGGIFNDVGGVTTVEHTSFSGNVAVSGGAIFNFREATVYSSSFSGNHADVGGGGIANFGKLSLVTNTFSDNSAAAFGGAIGNGGILTISNSTFAGNQAALGGGLVNLGSLEVKNTIVANNLAGGNCANAGVIDLEGTSQSFEGTFAAFGNNLDTDGSCPGFTPVTPDVLNLAPLADNGGSTPTHALLPGSLAIDAAFDCTTDEGEPLTTDQRGVERPQGTNCDIGAYESELPVE